MAKSTPVTAVAEEQTPDAEVQAPDAPEVAEVKEPSATGRIEVSTQIELEDRTDAPASEPPTSTRSEQTKLDSGTILTTYF